MTGEALCRHFGGVSPTETSGSSDSRHASEPEGGEQVVSIAGLVLSPRFQAAAGPVAVALMLVGYGGFRLAAAAGVPRAELIALLSLAIGVAIAAVAVTLGVLLLVSKQTPHRRAAAISIALGTAAFLLAAPLFLLVLGAAGGK